MPATTSVAATKPGYLRLLVPVGAMVAAGTLAASSGATFTATTSPATVTVTTGSLELVSHKAAALQMHNALPGDTQTGTVTVRNTGTVPADITMSETAVSDFPSGALNLTVTEVTRRGHPTEVFSGQLGSMGEQQLGTLEPGDDVRYDFEVTIDPDAGNAAQDKSAEATYTVDGVARH